jgi:hypothetical protein
VTIAEPANGSLYRDGAGVPMQGSAVDADGQPIPSTGLQWHVILHHSTSHIHDLGTFPGASNSFTPLVDHTADSWYDVTLAATDSGGLKASRTVTIYPVATVLTLNSVPAGAGVSYAGTNQTTPFTTSAAVGFHTSVSAVPQFTAADGHPYGFSSWSDGGARLHTVDIPDGGATLTARYDRLDAPPTAGAGGGKVGLIDHIGPVLTLGALGSQLRRGRLTGAAKDAGGVRLVEVAVRARRRGGTPCRWWSWRRRALGADRACSPPAWIRARLTGSAWSASLGRALPRGNYVVLVRAIDRSGNATTRITAVQLR